MAAEALVSPIVGLLLGHKIKDIRERLDEISENQTKFGFTNRVENRINVRRQRETHSFVIASEIIDLSYGSFVSVPKKLGNLRHLRYLNLGKNGKIKKLPNSICKLQSLQTLRLGGCEELQELPRDIRYLISLRWLDFSTNQKFLPRNGIERLDSLRLLSINSCNNLEYLVEDIGNLKALRTLFIVTCPNLVSLPSSIKRLSSLEELYLEDCEKLNLDWGMGTEEEDTHRDLNGTRPHLRLLYLSKLPQLVVLPQWLLRCSANTLRLLIIEECPKVASLPQDMHGFTALNKIEIEGCPTLRKQGGRDGHDLLRLAGHIRVRNTAGDKAAGPKVLPGRLASGLGRGVRFIRVRLCPRAFTLLSLPEDAIKTTCQEMHKF
ncbi:hypothetical protein EZV62_005296 [Acer yangbiense]|uniref:Disease resistance R13L4/SHOC-2-like LRR domain-containing protein n=1 Tax=Acer yangbiense TaxID=1000413 RepID=A0A5C7IM97_9ROSI|nr:hypothetical protein EZV62_005296 [Acer yangbiense]